ncbi:MAG TPA: SDR family oxidoreductase [Caulobacteraceae bacterium]|jgi:NAD(P)-dependent dehydrogenase (short-subunit alcohol dehydrogenase family)
MDRKAIFITGAASGIGLATAKRFAGAGWLVGLSDIDAGGLKAALAAVGGDNAGFTVQHDVRKADDWEQALDAFVEAAGGRLDVLVNNAGIARYGWFAEQSPADFDDQIDINLRGVVLGAYLGHERLKKTPGSRLINIASAASLSGSPRLAVYSATKFAVRGLSEALDIEFMRSGVRVSCVEPTVIETPLLDKASAPGGPNFREAISRGMGAALPVEDAAEAVWRAAHDEPLHYPVGAGPAAMLEEINPRIEATRARWSEMFKSGQA